MYIVGERPFCYWDSDISQKTAMFLENLDPSYFESMANVFVTNIEEPLPSKEITLLHKFVKFMTFIRSKKTIQPECDPQHAALALRMIYSQSLETLFALIAQRFKHLFVFMLGCSIIILQSLDNSCKISINANQFYGNYEQAHHLGTWYPMPYTCLWC